MAEKRKLLAEIEKCFKKIDEGVELFEETMNKMQEANSDNQREKYQDDLKKEIKKLQRLRDQVKGWQNCSEIKDKEKLTHYRKLIEQRMEQFKDIERENKTKPHSKQGLSAEEKLDPREKEKSDTIEWLQNQIRELSDESDRTESQIESISSSDGGKRRGKKDDGKKGEKEKRMDELKRHLERMKFHIGKLEICMRMVNNESLESKRVMEVLKDPLEMYVEALDSNYEGDSDELENLDPEDAYEELNLGTLCAQIGGVQIGSIDDDKTENGHDNGSLHDSCNLDDSIVVKGSRHGSQDTPASPAPRRTVTAASVPVTPAKLIKENSTDGLITVGGLTPATPPPPPPGIPYNSVAAGRVASTNVTPSTAKNTAAIVSTKPNPVPIGGLISLVTTTTTQSNTNDENRSPAVSTQNEVTVCATVNATVMKSDEVVSAESTPISSSQAAMAPSGAVHISHHSHANGPSAQEMNTMIKQSIEPSVPSSTITAQQFAFTNGPTAAQETSTAVNTLGENTTVIADISDGIVQTKIIDPIGTPSRRSIEAPLESSEDQALRVLRLSQQNQQPPNTEPQRAHIPAWLGASPLGRTPSNQDHDSHLGSLDNALSRTPLPMDSERPRTYLPKIPCPCASYYPQATPQNGDTLEYYLRLSPETLFFIFYYMEGTRAQLLAAKALKKLSWRFHTKYLTWFQRHEEPKQITDDFEQGTYVYFDYEKWSQRKKEAFTFEYRYLEDKDFE